MLQTRCKSVVFPALDLPTTRTLKRPIRSKCPLTLAGSRYTVSSLVSPILPSGVSSILSSSPWKLSATTSLVWVVSGQDSKLGDYCSLFFLNGRADKIFRMDSGAILAVIGLLLNCTTKYLRVELAWTVMVAAQEGIPAHYLGPTIDIRALITNWIEHTHTSYHVVASNEEKLYIISDDIHMYEIVNKARYFSSTCDSRTGHQHGNQNKLLARLKRRRPQRLNWLGASSTCPHSAPSQRKATLQASAPATSTQPVYPQPRTWHMPCQHQQLHLRALDVKGGLGAVNVVLSFFPGRGMSLSSTEPYCEDIFVYAS